MYSPDSESNKIIYWLDAQDCIVRVSSSWDTFAQENQGQDCISQHVIGKRLWSFIQGSVTRLWMDAVIRYARISGKLEEKRYRCDSPTQKRYMIMRVIPHTADLLEVQCNLEQELPLKTRLEFEAASVRIPRLITRCSICNRLKHTGLWLEPDDETLLSTMDCSHPIKVIYGVCPDCQEEVRRLRCKGTNTSAQLPGAKPSSVQSPIR